MTSLLVSHRGGLSLVGVALLLGCGGRSDTLLDGTDISSQGGTGTQTTGSSKGGSTTASGGSYATGGYVSASGGYTTYVTSSTGSCCSTHSLPGCGNQLTAQCVCAAMPQCCEKSWTADCVAATTKLGCGGEICLYPSAGGAPAAGGTVGKGGTTSKGGTTGKGGSSAATGGSIARAGSTGKGGTSATTRPTTGGSGNGGSAPKGACCSAHDSSPGCYDAAIEKCVCSWDALCCAGGWDATCVDQVNAFGCGACAAGGATGQGGAGGMPVVTGGSSGTGAATALGGTMASAGAPIGVGGGSLGTGGIALGGAPASGGAVATGGAINVPSKMIDDLEDGDGNIYPIDGRQGYWYTFNDGTSAGVQQPTWGGRIMLAEPVGDRPSSKYAAWTAGSGFTNWGAGIGVYLVDSRYYDASKYRGIVFWAKVDPATSTVVRFDVPDIQTESGNGYCSNCWDYFGTTITMSTDWRRYSYLWSDLTQQRWADQFPKIMPNAIRSLRFSAPFNTIFSIYIDDVAFIP